MFLLKDLRKRRSKATADLYSSRPLYLTVVFVKRNQGNSVYGCFASPAVIDSGRLEQIKNVLIKFAVLYRQIENFQRAFNRNRFLVGTVCCRQGVKDVRNRHHAGLQRNFRSAELIRISAAIELLMMQAGNLRNLTDLICPWNLLQKIESIDNMLLNLPPLVLIQRTFADGEQANLIRSEKGVLVALNVEVLDAAYF